MIRASLLVSLLISFTLAVGERCHVCGHLSGETHSAVASAECDDGCDGHSHPSDHEHIFSKARLSVRVETLNFSAALVPPPAVALDFAADEAYVMLEFSGNHDPCSPLSFINPVLRC